MGNYVNIFLGGIICKVEVGLEIVFFSVFFRVDVVFFG